MSYLLKKFNIKLHVIEFALKRLFIIIKTNLNLRITHGNSIVLTGSMLKETGKLINLQKNSRV